MWVLLLISIFLPCGRRQSISQTGIMLVAFDWRCGCHYTPWWCSFFFFLQQIFHVMCFIIAAKEDLTVCKSTSKIPAQPVLDPLTPLHVIYPRILRASKTQKMELRRSPESNLWILSTARPLRSLQWLRCTQQWVIVLPPCSATLFGIVTCCVQCPQGLGDQRRWTNRSQTN